MRGKHIFLTIIITLTLIAASAIVYQNNKVDATRKAFEEDFAKICQSGYEKFDAMYPGDWSIQDEKIYKGDCMMNEHKFIYEDLDDMYAQTGAYFTIFQDNIRVATNVKKDDGSRAVGTKQSDTRVTNSVLTEGRPYVGDALVVNTLCHTQYTPIKDADGNVIGMWFTGISKAPILKQQNLFKMTIAVSLLILVAAQTVWLLINFFAARKRIRENTYKSIS